MNPVQWFQGIAEAVSSSIGAFWSGLVGLLDTFAGWWLEVVASVIEAISGAFTWVNVNVASGMPEVLAPNHSSVDTGMSELAWVNTYVPVVEALALLGIWVVIFSGIGIVKLIRLVSPVSS
jgi:hypothetical protein